MSRAYYNEIDKFAAQWLRNLIAKNLIAPGDVDERSIEDVCPHELDGYAQHHFFAGIGGWSLALRYAGWADDRPVWTGSCPCQPFSAAGKGAGFADERHLWPAFHHLIRECRPAAVFGEQVASKDGLAWLDIVQSDMESSDYAFAAADMCAAGVGAPHIRQRLYWLAQSDLQHQRPAGSQQARAVDSTRAGEVSELADSSSAERNGWGTPLDRRAGLQHASDGGAAVRSANPTNGFWGNPDWIGCRDGKFRPIEPGTFPLANGAPARVGRLRGYGNAIVPPLAAEFIAAYMECRPQPRKKKPRPPSFTS